MSGRRRAEPVRRPRRRDDTARTKSGRRTRGLLYYLGFGLSAGLLAFVILVGVLAVVVPAATGATPMTILTSSMVPTYPPGTLIIVKKVDSDSIRIGDAITYQLESGKAPVVTHRVIAITSTSNGERTFTTMGDANGAADQKPVQPVQVRGRVWYSIPYIGWVNTVVNGESRSWLIPVIAGGLFLYAGYAATSGIVGSIKRRRLRAAGAPSTPGAQ